jgi:hypothetical protein
MSQQRYLFEQQQALDTGYTALKSYIANIGVVVVAKPYVVVVLPTNVVVSCYE